MKVYHTLEYFNNTKHLVSTRYIGNWYEDGQPPLKPTISEEVRDRYFKSPYKIAEDGYVRFKQDSIISQLKKLLEEECEKEKEKAMFNDVKVLYDGHSYRPTTIEMIDSKGEAPVLRIECPVGYIAYHAVTPKKPEPKFPGIKKVVYNPPATIVFWDDNTKTVVQCRENDSFDPEKGLAMAITKKALGNKHEYYNVVKKWLKKAPKPKRHLFLGKRLNINEPVTLEFKVADMNLKPALGELIGKAKKEDADESESKNG